MALVTLIRSIGLLALIICGTAIGVGKLAPPPAHSSVRLRTGTTQAGVNGVLFPGGDRSARLVDAENGSIRRLETGRDDRIEHLSVSPWTDAESHQQAVGRWFHREGDSTQLVPQGIGLARVELPSGRLLDRIETRMAPVAPPCWSPGLEARVIFAAGDGRLYRYAFEKADSPYSTSDEKPVALTWRCKVPGEGDVYLAEPTRPTHPQWKGKLLVSLNTQIMTDGLPKMSVGQIWWLKLNDAETEIVAAGLVTGANEKNQLERCPTVVGSPSNPALAYVSPGQNGRRWQLRVAPVEFLGEEGAPVARTARSVVLATDCAPAPPAVSSDGLRLTFLVRPETNNASHQCVNLAGVLKPEAASLLAELNHPGVRPESR
ncbi:hypothetical protein EP7_001486 [Isosphaeraceae bacterium EP7]